MSPALFAWLLALPLELAPTAPDATLVDAFFDEWAQRPKLAAKTIVSGVAPDPRDFSAQVGLSYDGARLYVAIEAVDDTFQAGGTTTGDRVSLRFAPAGGAPKRLELALNRLEDAPPTLLLDGKPLRGVKLEATERRDGWAVELSLPTAGLPWLKGPVAFAAVFVDADADAIHPETVAATAVLDDAGDPVVPTFELGGTGALLDAFRAAEGDPGRELSTFTGQIVAGGPEETLIVTDRHLVLIGHGLPQRAAYMFFDPGWRADPTLGPATLRDVDGRPGLELVIEHTEWAVPGETQVSVVEIYGVHDGYLKRMFAQKVGEATPATKQSARTEVDFLPTKRGAWRLRVKPAKVQGFNPGNYTSADIQGTVPFEPLPMPWEGTKPRLYSLAVDVWRRR